jgi:uncharacterized protein
MFGFIMEKSQAARIGMLALLALGMLMAGSFFMSSDRGPEAIVVSFPSGARMQMEVADTPLMLHAGLAFRDSLSPGWGMLFIYERPDFHRVVTRQYRFPVDLVWLDEAKRVVLVAENALPCQEDTCPSYGPPPEKALYVIATPAGFVQYEHLVEGAGLRFALQL